MALRLMAAHMLAHLGVAHLLVLVLCILTVMVVVAAMGTRKRSIGATAEEGLAAAAHQVTLPAAIRDTRILGDALVRGNS